MDSPGTDDDLSDDDFPDPGSDLDLSPPTTESEESGESEESSDRDSDMEEGYVLGRTPMCSAITLTISFDRPEYMLTEDQVNMLQRIIPEFRGADIHGRSAIIADRVKWIKERSQPGAAFNLKSVREVSTLSITLGVSHINLDCSSVSLWQGQMAKKDVCACAWPKMDLSRCCDR